MLEVNADVVGVVLSFLAFPDRQRLRQVCRTTRGWVNDFSANIVQRVTGIADGSGVSALALLCPGIGGVVTPLGGRVGQRRRAVQLVDAEVVQEYLVALKRGPGSPAGNIMEIFHQLQRESGARVAAEEAPYPEQPRLYNSEGEEVNSDGEEVNFAEEELNSEAEEAAAEHEQIMQTARRIGRMQRRNDGSEPTSPSSDMLDHDQWQWGDEDSSDSEEEDHGEEDQSELRWGPTEVAAGENVLRWVARS